MQNPVDELAEIRERADVTAQVDERARARLEPVSGEDESGEVSVRLDPDGRVSEVRVGFAWDRSLAADELAPAVMSALATARMTHLERYAEAIEEAEQEEPPRARPAPTGTATVVDALRARLGDDADDPAAAAALVEELLGEARDGLDEANRLLDDHAGREHQGRSSSGHVRARALGTGELVGLDVDLEWLRRAHPANLGREITQAVQAAAQRAEKEGLRAALAAGRLARLARLAVTDVANEAGDDA